ncbi:entericidin [Marinicauda salina]|jgi:predicted small secreted protein|uniref:Entericidin n=1 Tax=Marinicauda salina TaxID=2135793 RepID=A0A2U2BXT3_9PROT|nr:entericidin [Marinicauda salina]PWE18821.1 entericidin [Marinicauda salina]
MKLALRFAAVLAAASALAACQTIQGLGRDITRTGETIEDVTTD